MSIIEIILLVAAVLVGAFLFMRECETIKMTIGFGTYGMMFMVMVTAAVIYFVIVGFSHAYWIGVIFFCYLYFMIITMYAPTYIAARRAKKDKK